MSAVTLVTESKEGTPSLGIKLLADIRKAFGGCENLTTSQLLSELNGLDEAPWGDLRGKPLDPRGLARMLAKYGVKPATVRTGLDTAKGYRRADLHDAWSRYLVPPPMESVTNVTCETDLAP